MSTFALVVPLFDEEDRFPDFAKLLADFIATRPRGSELILVDDGSRDRTASLADELADGRPFVRVMRRPHLGKGAAVAAGLASAVADHAGFCDLDLSTPLDQFEKVVDAARSADVLAIGSRDLTASTLLQREGRIRETLGRAYNRLLQATVTPGVVDTQCGAKAASRRVWERILPHCSQRGFAWDAEVVAVAQALGIGVREVPIAWRHDRRSRLRVGRDGVAMVRETPAIWRSAQRARALARRPSPASHPLDRRPPPSAVFDDARAEELMAADRTHWWFRSKAAFVATALSRTGGATAGVLADVGGGAGGVTAMLGWDPDRVVVLEGGAALVLHARRANGLPAVRAPVSPLPLRDASVDVVCLLDVIEHLADPRPSLLEARRVLRPGGRLVVNVPAHAWLWSAADVHLGHHRRYDRGALRAALAGAGFEPLLLGHVFSWLVPAVWLERRLRSRDEPALGLDRTSFLLDRLAMVLTAVERTSLGRVALPLGTSLLTVARPTDRPDGVRPTTSPRGTPPRR